MMRFTLFKSRPVKGFQFQPRYYNPQKEEFDMRVAAIKAEYNRENGIESDSSYNKEAVRGRIRSEWNAVSERSASNKASNIRVFVLIGILSFAFYLYLFTDTLDFIF